MRSISDFIVKTTPRNHSEDAAAGPIACAAFITVLAVMIAGGAVVLGNSIMTSNAHAATQVLAYE